MQQSSDPVRSSRSCARWEKVREAECRFLSFQSQCFLQQAGGLAGKVQRSSGFGLVHLLQVFQQMAEAFLFEPVVQSAVIVGQEPIGGQDAGEVIAQDVEDHIAAAVGADGVDGEITMCEDPQPGRERADPPAGLIGIHDTTLPDGLQQFFIHGSSGASQLLIRLAPATAADLQPKGIVEHFTDLAIRDPQAMLQISRQRLRSGSHHHAGRPCGLRGLLGMLRAHPLMAVRAVPAVAHKVRGLHFHHWNIGDKLFMLVDRLQMTSTGRAAMQFCLFPLQALHHSRQFSMRKLPLPCFASRTFRFLHPMPPRERRRLTLPDPLQILDLFLLLLHHLFQPFDLLLQLLVQLQCLRQLLPQIPASVDLWFQENAYAACVLCSCPSVYRLSRFTDKSRCACLFPDVRALLILVLLHAKQELVFSLLYVPFPELLRQQGPSVPFWQSFLAIFYGGIGEEILFRLFVMSLLVWISFKD